MSEKEIHCDNTDDVVCPYCGHEDSDTWEMSESGSSTCGSCEKEFMFDTEQSRTFSTWKADCLNGASHAWKAIPNPSYPNAKRCKDCDKHDWLGKVE